MQVIHWTKFGGAEVLMVGDLPKPVPKSDEILIKVKAFTVNRTDCAMLKSSLWVMRLQTGLFKPNQPVLGTDFAGVIEAAGANVDRFAVGDRVFGLDVEGIMTHAEYLIIKQTGAVEKIPENVDFITAAASLEGPHYAENILNKVKFEKGQSVFVHGATGGIGSALTQLCKLSGGVVTASGRTEHLELLRKQGADHVIDYTGPDFWKHKKQYDYVVDSVGKGTFGKFKPMLKSKGIYISSELGPGGQNLFLALFAPLTTGKKVRFPVPFNQKKSVEMMAKFLAEGKFKPLIDREYEFVQTPEAFAYVLEGQKVGNVVVAFD